MSFDVGKMTFFNVPDVGIWIFLSGLDKLLDFLNFLLACKVVLDSFCLVEGSSILDDFLFVKFVLN
jgi:hypothetical protein